jgi:WD40 repeat protein
MARILRNVVYAAVGCVISTAAGAALLPAQDQPKQDNSNDPVPKMGSLRELGLSADGALAFAGDSDRNIWVWDIARRQRVRVIRDSSPGLNDPHYAFSTDGKFAVLGYGDVLRIEREPQLKLNLETFSFWDLVNGVKVRAFELRDEPVFAVALSPDGKRALSISHTKTVFPQGKNEKTASLLERRIIVSLRLWDTSNGKPLKSIVEQERLFPVAFTRDSKSFIAAFVSSETQAPKKGWTIKRWQAADGNLTASKEMANDSAPVNLRCMTPSADGKYVALGHFSDVSMWNLETGARRWCHNTSLPRGGPTEDRAVDSVSFSANGDRVVVSGSDPRRGTNGTLTVLDAANGNVMPVVFLGRDQGAAYVVFTADGTKLVGTTIGGVRFWDAQRGKPCFTLTN